MRRRISRENLENVLEEEGYKLLLYNGFGNKTMHLSLCPNGHEWSVSWSRFMNNGSRCLRCSNNCPVTEKDFRELLDGEGYKLLQYNGSGSTTKHQTLCPKGHRWTTCWTIFVEGHRCSKCADNSPVTEEDIKEVLEEEGYKLIQYNGLGSSTKHLVLCPEGHEWTTGWTNFVLVNSRCFYCSGNSLITKQEFVDVLGKEGYKLLQYNGFGNKTMHLSLCPKGHEWSVSWSNFVHLHSRCHECIIFRSELNCKNIFEKILTPHKFIKSRPSFLLGLELDGYCKELNMGFEYNGMQHYEFNSHFHKSEKDFNEQKERDQRKEELCKRNGIYLCVIPYKYNYRNPEQMEFFIKNWIISPVFDDKGGVLL
jgi:lysozyme family protein